MCAEYERVGETEKGVMYTIQFPKGQMPSRLWFEDDVGMVIEACQVMKVTRKNRVTSYEQIQIVVIDANGTELENFIWEPVPCSNSQWEYRVYWEELPSDLKEEIIQQAMSL